MKSRVMAVYDVDPYYADRFAEFVNLREKLPFIVMPFSSLERLKKYAKEHSVEVLLIHDKIPGSELEQIPAGQIITLSEGETLQTDESYPSVYKYQSSDSIVREVMATYCETPKPISNLSTGIKAWIVGIYSPVKRCLKTSFGLTMGQLLARDSKVLYLNFEEFSGLSQLTNASYREDLSDVLYYFRQESCTWMRLGSVIHSWGDMDYIPPARYPEDLYQIEGTDLARLVRQIGAESDYETLILDLGQMGKRSVEIMETCDIVYMPVKEDTVSAAKIHEFDQYLKAAGKEELADRIHKVKLPYHNSFGRKDSYIEQLLWGELGDYVRQLLKGSRMT